MQKRSVMILFVFICSILAVTATHPSSSTQTPTSTQTFLSTTGGLASITGGTVSTVMLTGAAVAPSGCTSTYLPGYREYYGSTVVKQVWDDYTARSDGYCRMDKPRAPAPGECKFVVQLSNPTVGQYGTMCWYAAALPTPTAPPLPQAAPQPTTPQPTAPQPKPGAQPVPWQLPQAQPVSLARDPGFFNWLKSLFTPDPKALGMTLDDAEQRFIDDVLSQSDLGKNAAAYLYPGYLPAGTVIQDGVWAEQQLGEAAFFAWLDVNENAMFGHPTFYMFLYEDGTLEVLEGNGWAVVNGKDIRDVGKLMDLKASPSGAMVGPTGLAIQEDPMRMQLTIPKPRQIKHPAIVELPAPSPSILSELTGTAQECPPGYTEVETEGTIEEAGYSATVVGEDHPRPSGVQIDFEGEAARFTAAMQAATFESMGSATSVGALIGLMQAAAELPPPSTFALFISSHGLDLWDVTLAHKRTGVSIQVPYYAGEPKPGGFAIDPNVEVISKSRSGWCFSLGGKCVKFDTDTQFGPLPSCRKFLASNACYGGNFVKHSVQGLSAYAGSQADQPGVTLPLALAGANRKIPTWFGMLFVGALNNAPPLDPKHPQIDEPKPEFDAAFAAAQQIRAGEEYTIRTPGITYKGKFVQTPVMHSIPHIENCAQLIECVPYPWEEVITDPTERVIVCETAYETLPRMPRFVEAMGNEGDAYGGNRQEEIDTFISMMQVLKECGECPPDKTKVWENCVPTRDTLIDRVIASLNAFKASGYVKNDALVGQMDQAIAELLKCELKCVGGPIESVLPDLSLYDPTTRGCPTGTHPSISSCNRACPAPGNCVRQGGCYSCVSPGRPTTGTEAPQEAIRLPPSGEQISYDCNTICSDRGRSTSPEDHSSYIMSQLNQRECVSGASIKMSSVLQVNTPSGSCTCYSSDKPSITFNEQSPTCPSPCGEVPCNGELSCPCPDRSDCILTATCKWGGWRQVSPTAFVPRILG